MWNHEIAKLGDDEYTSTSSLRDTPAWQVFSDQQPVVAWDLLDNASQHCRHLQDNVVCDGECPNIFWKILTWAKIIAIKVARSYYAFPAVLILIPLVFGVLVGFWFGRRSSNQSSFLQRKSSWKGLLCLRFLGTFCTSLLSPFASSTRHSDCSGGQQREQDSPSQELLKQISLSGETIEGESDDGAAQLQQRESRTRQALQQMSCERESGVPLEQVPQHIAIIMDGNRRYGRETHGDATRGHWEGSRKLLELTKWCQAEGIRVVTVYAFSTENWHRDAAEVAALMSIFLRYAQELRVVALEQSIRVRVLSTATAPIPAAVRQGLERLQHDTRHGHGLLVNVCLSYGSRGEIVGACRDLVRECSRGELQVDDITEEVFADRLLTGTLPDPDILIRTSGEVRISNFLLWQLAYSELFFLEKKWPEMEKEDLLDIIRTYAKGRKRRFGK